MDVHRLKQENELLMQPPPGFAHRQGNALGKEAANVNSEDEKTDSCNKNQNAKEIAADDDDLCEEGPESRTIEVPDPDFYDFDRDRTEECLAADQIWAICDDLDAMPRLYALIRKIYSPFEARIIWLDFVSDNKDEKDWDTSGLPVACGKFEHGDNDTLEGIGKFSHRIVWEKDGRNTYKIYPRKGEIWAIYKNWNIKWSSDPNNHREYEYEFVEVLSDYDEDIGVMVASLVKLQGFVCMFKPVTTKNGMDIVQIPSDELLRFSHMVPSFRTTGKEREDVPEGYFVLDPAALPNTILEEVPADVIVSERVHTSSSSTMNTCQLPESELYVFDVHKSHDKFQTGQVWALYDKVDSLPKCYARINKVESYPRFKVHIQWLDNEMPTCCGLFSSGETAEFDETARFSHLAKGAVAKTRNKYEIYPRDGEVWAIYREFNSGSSSSGLQKCQYDVGKVVKVNGTIKVLVLEKVSGYLTVFKGRKKPGNDCILEIPRRDLHRFSHQMPAFQLTDEKEGTLHGCWKLDPNAMPVSLFYLDSCKETTFSDQDATKETGPNGMRTNPDIVAEKSSHEIRKRSQVRKSKKRKNSEQKNTMDGGRNMAGNSSTRFADVYHQKPAEGASNCKDAAAHSKERSPGGLDVTPTSVNEQILTSKIPATVFCNFDDERSSHEKFKTGQVWALYCKLDDLPKNYARIESVELFPVFKLTIKWLESRHPPRGVVPWVDKGMPVCCGTFNVANWEGVVFKDSISFCHQLSGVPSVNNVYTIYPRAGEVWALHSKICSDMMCSNMKICEYHLVEILELVNDRWIIVSVLQSVTGFKTVFKVKEREALDSIIAIPWIELYRFSHQVPSFMLKEARYGELRGCWELDPRSMPVHLYSSH